VKQFDAKRLFECPHQLADRRRRDVQLISGRDIAQMARGRFERAQRIQVVGRSHSFRKSFAIPVAQIFSVGGNSINDHSFVRDIGEMK
jgi:hypothetical protein